MRSWRAGALASALLVCAFAPATSRADFTILMDDHYNGTAPSGSAPWGKAEFKSLGSGVVRLTMTNLLQSTSEFIPNGWFFNLGPAKNSSNLSFSFVSGQAAKTISKGNNSVEPPGQGGDFDFVFSFETANNVNRFKSGETSVYDVTLAGFPGLTAEDFKFLSENEANQFVSVMKVQGIPPGGASGEVGGSIVGVQAVPAPAGVLLGLAGAGSLGGFAGLGWLRRRLGRS